MEVTKKASGVFLDSDKVPYVFMMLVSLSASGESGAADFREIESDFLICYYVLFLFATALCKSLFAP